ncbi:MAG: M15 family metallopeptidase [Steroidobacteraceae bacterium]
MSALETTLAQLGITTALLQGRQLILFNEPEQLVVAETSPNGREHMLTPDTAKAWQSMKQAALTAGIDIFIFSAFRSIARQAELIQGKLDRGDNIADILKVLAPPGYSEHHTGRAIDISTLGVRAVQEEFATTSAYAWLSEHAHEFGFVLSYPAGNQQGYQYEPWHWCYHAG